jgi:hypothetical protein
MDEHAVKTDDGANGTRTQLNFGVLQERVANFDRRLVELSASLERTNVALNKATEVMASLGKTKWPVLFAGGTLICVVTAGAWGLAISPINDRMKDDRTSVKESIQRLESEIALKASKDDLNRVIIDVDKRLPRK